MSYAVSSTNHGQQPQPATAQVACTSCQRKKRKCDRKKPSCSRCLTNRQSCFYEDLYPAPESGRIESVGKTATSGFLMDPAHLIKRYDTFIHPWLPIVDVSRLKDRLHHPKMMNAADAEVGNLLLCINAATQPSSTKVQSSAVLQELYDRAQNAFASSQILNKFSIETTQCGLLLTVYQLGAGLFSDAYVTLSTTTGLARVRHLKSTSTRERPDLEEQAVWCAVFLLDRLIALASLPQSLPLLVEQPRSLAEVKRDFTLGVFRDKKNDTVLHEYEDFCAEIEAAYLAGQALYLLRNPGDCQNLQFEEMNSRLTVLLSGLFGREFGSWRPLCSSMAIVFVANTELQLTRLIDSDSSTEAYQSSLDTLSIFLGIILDIAKSYVADQAYNPNRDVVPIACVIANYRAFLAICRTMALQHAQTAEDMKRLEVLKEALEINSFWWGLAGTFSLSSDIKILEMSS